MASESGGRIWFRLVYSRPYNVQKLHLAIASLSLTMPIDEQHCRLGLSVILLGFGRSRLSDDSGLPLHYRGQTAEQQYVVLQQAVEEFRRKAASQGAPQNWLFA